MLTENECKMIAQQVIHYFESDLIFKQLLSKTVKKTAKTRQKYVKPEDEEYYNKHKEYMRQYYQSRKKEILTRQKMKSDLDNDYFSCPCGGLFRRTNKTIHEKSKRHVNWEATVMPKPKDDGINFYTGSQVVKIHYGSSIEI